jgi:hypothetical protein
MLLIKKFSSFHKSIYLSYIKVFTPEIAAGFKSKQNYHIYDNLPDLKLRKKVKIAPDPSCL